MRFGNFAIIQEVVFLLLSPSLRVFVAGSECLYCLRGHFLLLNLITYNYKLAHILFGEQ